MYRSCTDLQGEWPITWILKSRFMDVSLLCQFATWTFRYHLTRFATWMIRHLDVSHLWRFDTRTFRCRPGCFATCLKLCNLWYCKNFLSSGGKTSREVAKRPGIVTSKGAKRPKVQNVQVAKRSGGKTSRWRTGEVAKCPVTCYQCHISRKWYKIELYLQWQSYMIYRIVPFSVVLNDS